LLANALRQVEMLLDDAFAIPREEVNHAPPTKGAYALVFALNTALDCLHKGAEIRLSSGIYVYAGSAYGPGGLRARLRRHFRQDKRIHWHVDALTSVAADRMVALAIVGGRECAIIGRLMRSGDFHAPVSGFGSSDCAQCAAHLLALRS